MMTQDQALILAARALINRILRGYYSCYCPHGACCARHDQGCYEEQLKVEAQLLERLLPKEKT